MMLGKKNKTRVFVARGNVFIIRGEQTSIALKVARGR
jgi:hypothetical protein